MKEGQNLWTREQLILTINLYNDIRFGQMHKGNEKVIELSALIDRSPSAIALKLGNFASFDPKLHARGIKGLPNTSKLDKQIWNEFMQDWDVQYIESEILLANKKHTTIEKIYNVNLDEYDHSEGREVTRIVKSRVGQDIFRRGVLTNFDNKCCITSLGLTDLLVASHIAPWSVDSRNRLNPNNGLSLNALHDKAFDRHLITITEDLKVKISSIFYKHKDVESISVNFIAYDGKEITPPQKISLNTDFLKAHNDKFKA